jgi:class 3 adenylate cyclase
MDLPAGTVTVLFTDIEGSTRLIAELGEEGYVQALAEHRCLRAELEALGCAPQQRRIADRLGCRDEQQALALGG